MIESQLFDTNYNSLMIMMWKTMQGFVNFKNSN